MAYQRTKRVLLGHFTGLIQSISIGAWLCCRSSQQSSKAQVAKWPLTTDLILVSFPEDHVKCHATHTLKPALVQQ